MATRFEDLEIERLRADKEAAEVPPPPPVAAAASTSDMEAKDREIALLRAALAAKEKEQSGG